MSEEELKLLKKEWKKQENLKPVKYYSEDYVKELQERIDKAIKYIEKRKQERKNSNKYEYDIRNDDFIKYCNNELEILKGER